MKYFLVITFLLLASSLCCEDQLHLSGYVVSYDKDGGIAIINVATPGCEGVRKFYFKVESSAVPLEKGRIVHFYINSSECEAGKTYEMILRKR